MKSHLEAEWRLRPLFYVDTFHKLKSQKPKWFVVSNRKTAIRSALETPIVGQIWVSAPILLPTSSQASKIRQQEKELNHPLLQKIINFFILSPPPSLCSNFSQVEKRFYDFSFPVINLRGFFFPLLAWIFVKCLVILFLPWFNIYVASSEAIFYLCNFFRCFLGATIQLKSRFHFTHILIHLTLIFIHFILIFPHFHSVYLFILVHFTHFILFGQSLEEKWRSSINDAEFILQFWFQPFPKQTDFYHWKLLKDQLLLHPSYFCPFWGIFHAH